jgi:hypothetical protein
VDETTEQTARRFGIVELAERKYGREGEIEFDEASLLSETGPLREDGENGAYVQCWAWVDFYDTPFDKRLLENRLRIEEAPSAHRIAMVQVPGKYLVCPDAWHHLTGDAVAEFRWVIDIQARAVVHADYRFDPADAWCPVSELFADWRDEMESHLFYANELPERASEYDLGTTDALPEWAMPREREAE